MLFHRPGQIFIARTSMLWVEKRIKFSKICQQNHDQWQLFGNGSCNSIDYFILLFYFQIVKMFFFYLWLIGYSSEIWKVSLCRTFTRLTLQRPFVLILHSYMHCTNEKNEEIQRKISKCFANQMQGLLRNVLYNIWRLCYHCYFALM